MTKKLTHTNAYTHANAIFGREQNGKTPLICASEKGYADFAMSLLDRGADISAQDDVRCQDSLIHPLHHHVSNLRTCNNFIF